MKRISILITVFMILFTITGCKEDESPVCTTTQELVEGVCVEIEEPITCLDDQELVGETCVDIEPEPVVAYDYGVFNGDFEFNMQYWEYYTLDGFHDIDSNVSRSGEKSLSVENGSSLYTSIWQTIDLDQEDGPRASDFVTFEAYFKGAEGITGNVQLIVENVINESTKVVLTQSEKTALTTDWQMITTGVGEIPADATSINIVMIIETDGVVHIDDVSLASTTSNNANLSMIQLDTEDLEGFLPEITEYVVYLPTTDIPTVTADKVKDDSGVTITEASNLSEQTTIVVTAADGTIKTYTISFVNAATTDLAYLKLDDMQLVGFDAARTEYFVLLDDATLPVVTYDTFYDDTVVTVSTLTSAPGVLTITVTNDVDVKLYTIEFDVADESMYSMPNFDFESTFDWQTWSGTANNPELSTDMVHSGLYSLKTVHQSSVWKELEFTTEVPNIDDAVKIGAWIYIDSDTPLYDFRLKVVGYTESTSSKETFVEAQIFDGISLNQWVYIESSVSDIRDCDRIQIVFENNADSDIYIDDVVVIEGISSNADLDEIILDSITLNGFDPSVTEYTFLTDGVNIPTAVANADNNNASVTVTPATSVDGEITISVTAVDGTVKLYTIDLIIPSSGLLSSIEIDGVALSEFDAVRETYYVLLPSGTTALPTVTATSVDVTDTVTVSSGMLPGYVIVTVTTTDLLENEYYVYFEVSNDAALSTPYPDVNFDKNMENWGVSNPADVAQSTEQFLNGSKSLKMTTGEAWVGFDLAGGDYPSKGNTYSVGMWIYVEGTTTTGFRVRLLEKDNNVELLNEVMSVSENGKWVYVETQVSSANVSEAAGYLQIVITNETGETVFVDGIRFIEHAPAVVVTGDTEYTLPGLNLDFEDTTDWGTWSPTGTGVAYDTTVVRDTQSLKMMEGSAWIGFGFDGSGYPAKGDTVKLGFWVYVDSSTATSVGGFTIKLLEKEGVDPADTVAILYTTTDAQFNMDEWVYIETSSATITDDPSYLQIVVEEGTDGTVYLDDVTVIKVND